MVSEVIFCNNFQSMRCIICVSVDGNYCITAAADKTVKLWNPHKDKGLLLKTYSGHGYEVLDACGSCDNAQIASGGMDKMVYVWDVTTGKPVKRYRGHFCEKFFFAIPF